MAQYNLGLLYSTSRGVPQDYITAYTWFNIAAAQGLANAKQGRDAAAAYLNTTSLAMAQKLSDELFKFLR